MVVTKEADMGKKERKAGPAPAGEPMASEGVELPERWSVQRKTELVLRLLRGEALDAVSRESQVPAHELESWRRVFLDTGTRDLKTRAEPEERDPAVFPAARRPVDPVGTADPILGYSEADSSCQAPDS
jgi:hypothetical protein